MHQRYLGVETLTEVFVQNEPVFFLTTWHIFFNECTFAGIYEGPLIISTYYGGGGINLVDVVKMVEASEQSAVENFK